MGLIQQIVKQELLSKVLFDKLGYYQLLDDVHVNKLKCVRGLAFLSEKNYIKYQELLGRIEKSPYDDEKKTGLTLSASALFQAFSKIGERTLEELILLTTASFGLEIEDYTFYIGILSDEKVSSKLVDIGDFSNRLDLAYEIMDSQDEYPFDYLTPDNYEILVQNALSIIENNKFQEFDASSKQKQKVLK